MSGTSADGIDLTLVSFDTDNRLIHHASYYQPYDTEIALKITNLYTPDNNEIDRAFSLDIELAKIFTVAIKNFLSRENLNSNNIIAIGNHGQTIRHRPNEKYPFTLQIGNCQTLATLTGIRVVGQFRQKDVALGGQGAPLVPAFHQTIFQEKQLNNEGEDDLSDVFVVNIGGIANLTYLPSSTKQEIIGYDTGPGNALMDDWFQLHHPTSKSNYDKNGMWAKKGKVDDELLTQLLSDYYLQLPPPKSTGREYFNLQWLQNNLIDIAPVSNQDVQVTLLAFTAITIVNAIKKHIHYNKSIKVFLCGGGVHNSLLKDHINQLLKLANENYELLLTNHKGIDSDQLEAVAFAWLAYAYDKKLLSSISTVTGASKSCTLGNVYFP